MAAPAQKPADSPDLVYRLEDKPPFMNALLSAITHLLAIFVPMITPALIVGGALQLPVEMGEFFIRYRDDCAGAGHERGRHG